MKYSEIASAVAFSALVPSAFADTVAPVTVDGVNKCKTFCDAPALSNTTAGRTDDCCWKNITATDLEKLQTDFLRLKAIEDDQIVALLNSFPDVTDWSKDNVEKNNRRIAACQAFSKKQNYTLNLSTAVDADFTQKRHDAFQKFLLKCFDANSASTLVASAVVSFSAVAIAVLANL